MSRVDIILRPEKLVCGDRQVQRTGRLQVPVDGLQKLDVRWDVFQDVKQTCGRERVGREPGVFER